MAELGDALLTAGKGAGAAEEVAAQREEDEAAAGWPDITVEMMSYEYVDECTDPAVLRKILLKLKSGVEGKYPHLEQHTEDRLMSVLPDKERNRILRMRREPTADEIAEAQAELGAWERQMASASSSSSSSSGSGARGSRGGEITVRGRGRIPPSGEIFGDDEGGEERKAAALVRAKATIATTASTAAPGPGRRGGAVPEQLDDAARVRKATREKIKGNEHFRAGDNDKAYECYTKSIELDETNHIVFANRAMAAIRLKRYEQAENDCTHALQLNPDYNKARSRRGMTRVRRGKFLEAIDDFEEAMRREPDNAELPKLLRKAREQHVDAEGVRADPRVLEALGRTRDLRAAEESSHNRPRVEELPPEPPADEAVAASDTGNTNGSNNGFKKITLAEEEEDDDDDDDDDNDEEEGGDSAQPTTQDSGNPFTRIQIIDVDDDEEEEEETNM